MSAQKKKAAVRKLLKGEAIPFVQLFAEGERNARIALRDPTTPADLRVELERYLANIPQSAAEDQQDLLRTVAPYRAGGKKGRVKKSTATLRAHIRKLSAEHPKLKSALQLYKKADKAIIGNMAAKTFADHVRAVRNK